MRSLRGIQRKVSILLLVAFTFVSTVIAPAQAAMVPTADILGRKEVDAARQKVAGFMARQDVVQQLRSWGVDPEDAQSRVAALTDEEVNKLAGKIDQMPAGGDALGFLLALAVITFVVLVILDIAGVTDIFTFIKKR